MTFNFLAGRLNLSEDLLATTPRMNRLLGTIPTIQPGQHLSIAGETNLQTGLVLDGGQFSTGSLTGSTSLLDFRSGTLALTGDDLSIDSGGLLGSHLHLDADRGVHVTDTIVVAGSGELAVTGGEVQANVLDNAGTLWLDGGVASRVSGSTLVNTGMVRGHGRISMALDNRTGGQIRVAAGDTLTFAGSGHTNSGRIELLGGTVEVAEGGTFENDPEGLIAGHGAVLMPWLFNEGQMSFSGPTDVHGELINATGDPDVGIAIGGDAGATFWADVHNASGLFRVAANSSATFFGAFAGSGISGPGDVYFEAGMTPGTSPGVASFGGNVHLGTHADLEIEIAGVDRGTQHDALDVAGLLSVAGRLNVVLLDDFQPQLGDRFDVLSFSAVEGEFSQLTLPPLDEGLAWGDHLLTTGELTVVADHLLGDMNIDGAVDTADVAPFVQALTDPDGYMVQFGVDEATMIALGDINQDGAFDTADVAPFVQLLVSGGSTSVPEPGSLALLGLGGLLLLRRRGPRGARFW